LIPQAIQRIVPCKEVDMIAFTRKEIVPSTKVSRNLGALLNQLRNHEIEKIGVMRNNEMEAG